MNIKICYKNDIRRSSIEIVLNMEKIFLIFLVTFVYSNPNPTCSKYECGELETDECYRATIDNGRFNYTLQTCSNDKLCDFDSDVYHGKCSKDPPGRLPGEFCTDTKDCLNGKCEQKDGARDKMCKGLDEGKNCTLDEDCDPGLFCSKEEKCKSVVGDGKSCTEAKCGPGLVCDGENCVNILSKKINHSSSVPAACETFYVFNKTCKEGPTLTKKNGEEANEKGPIECHGTRTNCSYHVTNDGDIESECVCGMNGKNKSYCNPGIGEIDFDDVILP